MEIVRIGENNGRVTKVVARGTEVEVGACSSFVQYLPVGVYCIF